MSEKEENISTIKTSFTFKLMGAAFTIIVTKCHVITGNGIIYEISVTMSKIMSFLYSFSTFYLIQK